jgi:hypothetical protein
MIICKAAYAGMMSNECRLLVGQDLKDPVTCIFRRKNKVPEGPVRNNKLREKSGPDKNRKKSRREKLLRVRNYGGEGLEGGGRPFA